MRQMHAAAVMVLCFFSTAFAYDWSTNPGDGSAGNPYQISTAEQLMSIGSDSVLLSKNFILTNDIDLDPRLPGNRIFTEAVIAPNNYYSNTFEGSFDGNEHVIGNMKIFPSEGDGANNLGVFGGIGTHGRVRNLHIVNFEIFYIGIDSFYIGGLAAVNEGFIYNCHSEGTIEGTLWYVGGLVGKNGDWEPWGEINYPGGFIANSNSNCEIQAYGYVGGLFGCNAGTIYQCCANGNIFASMYCGGGIGGANIGHVERSYSMVNFTEDNQASFICHNEGTIKNCFSNGILGNAALAGFVGDTSGGQVVRCYSACQMNCGIGFMMGSEYAPNGPGKVESCFWDSDRVIDEQPSEGVPLTSLEMKNAQNFIDAGWDFVGETQNGTEDIWAIDPDINEGYPYLVQRPLTQGDGSAGNPYLIYLPEHFEYVMQNPSMWDKHIKMLISIDLTGRTFTEALIAPFSSGQSFTGIFDGNGCTIYGMKITGGTNAELGGLFGIIGNGGLVRDLIIKNAEITNFTGCGALTAQNHGRIERCCAQNCIVDGGDVVGGLVGWNRGDLFQCSADGTITGNWWIGGLVGSNGEGKVEQCAAWGYISGDDYVGGLIGQNVFGCIRECYAGFDDQPSTSSYVGGLVGRNVYGVIFMCYTSNTQLTGINEGVISLSYNNTQGCPYMIWDENVWEKTIYNEWPTLIWQGLVNESEIDYWPPYQPPYQTTGDGTANHPYQLTQANIYDLIYFPKDWNKHFVLIEDIDMHLCFLPYQDDPVFGYFDGVLDGQGHKITNVYLDGYARNGLGFFGVIGPNGQIKRLGIEGYLSNQSATGYSDGCGGLFAFQNQGTIEQCYAVGDVTANYWPGGFVFRNIGTIQDCYFQGSVTTLIQSPEQFAGGLAGQNWGRILRCYASAHLQGIYPQYPFFSGGVVGLSTGLVYNSFWDTDVSGTIVSSGGTGKTTEQMKQRSTYEGWGDGAWKIADGNSLPRLVWEDTSPQPPDFLELDYQIINDAPRAYGGGGGTESDPYILTTPEHLLTLGKYLNDADKYFRLYSDIDFTGYEFRDAPIGYFNGNFNGDGHVIRNLQIFGVIPYGESNPRIISCLGLFGLLDRDALVNKVGVEVNIDGHCSLGGIAGENRGRVRQCYSKGGVFGWGYVGGLVGINGSRWEETSAIVEDCYSETSVQGTNVQSGLLIQVTGGLVGWNDDRVIHSWSSGDVYAADYYPWGFGICGGLIGFDNYGEGVAENSFWDAGTSGQSTSYGGTAGEMFLLSAFTDAGWDFANETVNGTSDIWRMCPAMVDYPRLNWESIDGDFVCPDGVSVEDLDYFVGRWLMDDCASGNNYCGGADVNTSGAVDLGDWAVFAGHWLEGASL